MAAIFELERFEHVAATPDRALLRLSGRWRAEEPERLDAPVLVAGDARLEPLPGPEDPVPVAGPDAPPWRVAFSAPLALAGSDAVSFALDAGTGERVTLPAPRPAGRRAPRRDEQADAALLERRRQVERQAEERTRAAAAVERRLEDERQARRAAEQRAEREARERARQAERLDELERALREAQRRLGAAEDEAGRAPALERALEEARAEARRDAEERAARVTDLTRTLEQTRADARLAHDELDQARGQLEALAAEVERLRTAAAPPDGSPDDPATALTEARLAAEDRADRLAVHRAEALLRLRATAARLEETEQERDHLRATLAGEGAARAALESRLAETGGDLARRARRSAESARAEAIQRARRQAADEAAGRPATDEQAIAERMEALRAEAARRSAARRGGEAPVVSLLPAARRRLLSDRLLAGLLVGVGVAALALLGAGIWQLVGA